MSIRQLFRKPVHQRLTLEPLEDRLVLDGTVSGAPWDGGTDVYQRYDASTQVLEIKGNKWQDMVTITIEQRIDPQDGLQHPHVVVSHNYGYESGGLFFGLIPFTRFKTATKYVNLDREPVTSIRFMGYGFVDNFYNNTSISSTVYGGLGDDSIYGGPGSDTIYSQEGRDFIVGNSGNDYLNGGVDNDVIWGENENDAGLGFGHDAIFGGEGNDTLFGGPGSDAVIGDWLVNLYGRTIFAGNHDVMDGGRGRDFMMGCEGNDTISGGDEGDWLLGDYLDTLAAGSDSIHGGLGADVIYAGSGHDVADGGAGDDTLFGGLGYDALRGGADADTLYAGFRIGEDLSTVLNNLFLNGPQSAGFTVTLSALVVSGLSDTEPDILHGGSGADTLLGDDGVDTMDGGTGSDSLSGFGNNDILYGGGDWDVDLIDGGMGWDTFYRPRATNYWGSISLILDNDSFRSEPGEQFAEIAFLV